MADLTRALAAVATGYRESAPVFHILAQKSDAMLREAQAMLAFIWPQFGDCSPFVNWGGSTVAIQRLPSDGSLKVFPSGAIEATMFSTAARQPLTPDEHNADRKKLIADLHQIASGIAKLRMAVGEDLQFESLWEQKAQGVTVKEGARTPVALLAVVAGFRRYLHGLPVVGRASVHVGLGGGSVVNRWGIDWRLVKPEPFSETEIVGPEVGAQRVIEDLWWRRPERHFTTEDYEPKSFRLGYLAHSRHTGQFTLQPVWVAVLNPRKGNSMGHVIAVPAAPHAFEPIIRPSSVPPFASRI
jgi:hypothetical protein